MQGLTEAPPDLAYRVRHATDAFAGWGAGGLVTGVLEQLAGVLGPTPPVMRIVTNNGDWWTRYQDGHYELARTNGAGFSWNAGNTSGNPNGVVSTMAQAWDWASTSVPATPIGTSPGDWFLVVYMPLDTPYGTMSDGTFGDPGTCSDNWNDPTPQTIPNLSPWAGTVGTNAPRALVELVRGVVGQRQTAGFACRWICVATDPASFNPDGSSTAGSSRTAYPDGTWGWHTVYDPTSNTCEIARLQTAEYWQGPSDAIFAPSTED